MNLRLIQPEKKDMKAGTWLKSASSDRNRNLQRATAFWIAFVVIGLALIPPASADNKLTNSQDGKKFWGTKNQFFAYLYAYVEGWWNPVWGFYNYRGRGFQLTSLGVYTLLYWTRTTTYTGTNAYGATVIVKIRQAAHGEWWSQEPIAPGWYLDWFAWGEVGCSIG